MKDTTEHLIAQIEDMKDRLNKISVLEFQRWVLPYSTAWVGTAGAPLTSTSWDGDSFSTTAKTLIDLSAVFSVPAGVKAVKVFVGIKDSGSAGSDVYFILSPNNTAGSGAILRAEGLPNDSDTNAFWDVPCDANGDVYYQVAASGAGTMDVFLQIWGYLI